MARDEVIEDLYNELSSMIRRSRELGNELHPGLPMIAYTCLSLVEDTPEIQASDLAGRLGLDKSTVSRQLNQLIESGLVDREGGRPGRRGDPLSLTPKGRRVLAADADGVRERVTCWLADWDEDAIGDLAALMARFNASVGQSMSAGGD
jgi:DNA-binding MarR family transcriptional regulator